MDATTINLYLILLMCLLYAMRVSAGGSRILDPSHNGSGGRCRESGTGPWARFFSDVCRLAQPALGMRWPKGKQASPWFTKADAVHTAYDLHSDQYPLPT